MEIPNDRLQALVRYLAGEEQILLAYLFGSHALSSQIGHPQTPWTRKSDLLQALARYLGGRRPC